MTIWWSAWVRLDSSGHKFYVIMVVSDVLRSTLIWSKFLGEHAPKPPLNTVRYMLTHKCVLCAPCMPLPLFNFWICPHALPLNILEWHAANAHPCHSSLYIDFCGCVLSSSTIGLSPQQLLIWLPTRPSQWHVDNWIILGGLRLAGGMHMAVSLIGEQYVAACDAVGNWPMAQGYNMLTYTCAYKAGNGM